MCVKRETIKIETKMKKQMERTVYEAPVTERFSVELEGNFCGSVDLDTDNKDNGVINDHEVNDGFTGGDFSDGGWDKPGSAN